MRLNIRLIGVLAGIVFIGSIGDFIMRSRAASARQQGRGARSSSPGWRCFIDRLRRRVLRAPDQGRGLAPARVPRRRLRACSSRATPTASPARSTRSARRAAGALIAGALRRGPVAHVLRPERAPCGSAGLLDTHPPLDERIRRVNPRFQPSSYRAAPAVAGGGTRGGGSRRGRRVRRRSGARRPAGAGRGRRLGPLARREREAGRLDRRRQARLRGAPARRRCRADLREALREPDGASAAMVALLIAPKEEVMRQQLDAVARATTLAERVARARCRIPAASASASTCR